MQSMYVHMRACVYIVHYKYIIYIYIQIRVYMNVGVHVVCMTACKYVSPVCGTLCAWAWAWGVVTHW